MSPDEDDRTPTDLAAAIVTDPGPVETFAGDRYFDKEGQPIDLMTWGRLCQDEAYRRIASDEIGNVRIYTIWLGFDPDWCLGPVWAGHDRPHVFGTCRFTRMPDGGETTYEIGTYATAGEALAGHAQAVAAAKRKAAFGPGQGTP